jgi:hypothetical protein
MTTNKALYQQKMQAQLDLWKADLDGLRAKASSASADVQLSMHEHLDALGVKMDAGKAKLKEMGETSEDAWESFKDGVEDAWSSLKSGVHDVTTKFKHN